MRTQVFVPAAALLVAASCSTGPRAPQPGSPAYLWNAAKATWHSGDFVKTGETLQQLVKTESEFTARSRSWSILVASGLSQGYAAAAESYIIGAKANRQNPMPFHKEANQLRSMASAAALEFAEEVHAFLDKDKAATVALAFEFPSGGATEPPAMRKITSGAWLQDSERESLLGQMLQRGIVRSVSAAAGSPDDTPKAAELFKTPDVQRPRADFLYVVAKELYDRSDLFTASKLDHPARLRVLCQEALEALQGVPESKDSKALTTRIDAALKKIKGNT
jgi:hypothetical protein